MSDGRRITTYRQDGKPTRGPTGIWVLGLLAGISVLLALGGEATRLGLRYERTAILTRRILAARLPGISFTVASGISY